jgi:hypothetical protein
MRETQEEISTWIDTTKDAFWFATGACQAFAVGNVKTKRAIVEAIGWNQALKDKTFSFQAAEWLIPIIEKRDAIEHEIKRLEPTKERSVEAQKPYFRRVSPLVGG